MPSANSNRVTLKVRELAKALSLVASEYVKDGKGYKYKLDEKAASILLRMVAPDPNRGWDILRALDRQSIYGERVVFLYAEYFKKDLEQFASAALVNDRDMLKFLERNQP